MLASSRPGEQPAEPAAGAAGAADAAARRRRRAALGVAVASSFLTVLSTNVVNVALPSMMRGLGADVGAIEWVVTAYMLTFSVGLPVGGWLSDRFGRVPTFIGAIIVFVVGALAAGLAPTLPLLVAARVVQAAGASGLGPTAMGLLHEHFAPAERGRALGLWALGATLGPALGPTLGGVVIDHLGWRAVFFLYVPAGLAVLVVALRVLRVTSRPRLSGGFDARGLAGVVAFFFGLQLVLPRLAHGTAGPGGLVGAALLAAGALILAAGPGRGRAALVDLGLLRRRNYTAALALATVRSFALLGSFFLLPLYLQRVGDLSAMHTALLMLPGPLGLALGSPLAGHLTGRVDTRVLAVTGILLISGSLFALGGLGPAPPAALVLASQAVRGLGISLVVTPVMAAALDDMPQDRVGGASSLISITLQLGGALGVAGLNGVLLAGLARAGVALTAGNAGAAAACGSAFFLAGAVNLVGLAPAFLLGPRPQPLPALAPADPTDPAPGEAG